jgi:DNA-binding NtrC family response regulator
MFKCFEDQINVLGVCVDEALIVEGYNPVAFYAAYDARSAVEMMRQMRFDLLLVSSRLPDMAPLAMVQQARMMRIRPNWAMVGGPLSEQQKNMAMAHGAVGFFDISPTTRELVSLVSDLREQAIQTVLDSQSSAPARLAIAA